MSIHEAKQFYPKNIKEWRAWLAKNHVGENAVWLIYYKKKSDKPSISWSEAVDEALCFGWIDSTRKSLDHERSIQYFTKRKAKSTWSKINKEKVTLLIEKGLMMKAGLDIINIAKKNGSWEILDSVEALLIPDDLEAALNAKAKTMDNFLNLGKSAKKMMLHRLAFAKRDETRLKRISEILEQLSENKKHSDR